MREPVAVRPATVEDAPLMADLAVAAYAAYLPRLPDGVRPAPMDADYEAAVEQAEVWVTESDEAIIGYLVLRRVADHVLLENIAVHPDFQGHGVGRRLLALAEQRAAVHGLGTIRLYTNAVMVENQQLYERLGYLETHRQRANGLERVFYEKRL